MRHLLYLFGVTLVVIVAVSMSAHAQPYVIPLTVTNDTLTYSPDPPLGFGILHGGNPCLVPADRYLAYQEIQWPLLPDPNWQILSARFTGNPNLPPETSCFDQGGPVDFRPAFATGQKDTFYVRVQDGEPGWPVTISWPPGLGSIATELRIVDPVTYGSLFSQDMLTTQSFVVTGPSNESFAIIMAPIITPAQGSSFLSLTPTQVFDENPAKPGKSNKATKRAKLGKAIDPVKNFPTWSTMLSEIVAVGGFQPGTSESDSGGGARIGLSFMYLKDPVKHKWAPVKDSLEKYHWVRLSKWDFAKKIGKSYNAFQKTLYDKVLGLHSGLPRGLDFTTDGKNKALKGQYTKLPPKKHNNLLLGEMVALKVNIAASALGTIPAGFGELLFNRPGHQFSGRSVKQISARVDSAMTLFVDPLYVQAWYDSALLAVQLINRAFDGPLDTLQFNAYDSLGVAKPLLLKGQVDIGTVPYMQLPTPFIPNRITPANNEVESELEDFEDAEPEEIDGVPVAMTLMQNFPNPFNPTTTIAFMLAEDANVTITVFDMLGREIARLAEKEEFEGGVQTVEFSANGLASGVYFYRVSGENLETGSQIAPVVGKMVLMK